MIKTLFVAACAVLCALFLIACGGGEPDDCREFVGPLAAGQSVPDGFCPRVAP